MNQKTMIDIDNIFELAREKSWLEIIQALPNDADFSDIQRKDEKEHIELVTAVGMAYANVSQAQGDAALAEKATAYLLDVWDAKETKGITRHDGDVFWALVKSMYNAGKQRPSIDIINSYLPVITDANEQLKTGEWLSMVYEVMGDNKLSVKAFQDALSAGGEQSDDIIKFDAYNNTHVATALITEGFTRDWFKTISLLWQRLSNEEKSSSDKPFDRRFMLMFAIVKAVNLDDDFVFGADSDLTQIIQFFEQLVEEFAHLKEIDSPHNHQLQWFNVLMSKYSFYASLAKKTQGKTIDFQQKAIDSLNAAMKITHDFLEKSKQVGDKQESFRILAFQSCHNLGMSCRQFDMHQSVNLLKKAAAVTKAGDRNGPTHFWLSASILETGGDKKEALFYLAKVAEDKLWGYGGLCVRPQDEFFTHEAFASVREDNEFLEVINAINLAN